MKCNFDNFSHELHSNQKQLNSLVDLVINLASALEKERKNTFILFQTLQASHLNLDKKLKQIKDYLKDQPSNSIQSKFFLSYFQKDIERIKLDITKINK